MTGEKVLVIDDSEELRSLLEVILPFGGYEAFGVGSGAEGLDLVPKIQPDAILIDLELPDTTGLKLLEELNRLGFTVPTIMMTGYGSEGSAARALRLGVKDYLIKPFTTEEVLSSIERALSESRLRREKEQQAALLNDYARRFKLISAVGRSMPQGLDLPQILQRIVDAAQLATRAEVGLLLLKDEATQEVSVVVTSQGFTGNSVGLASDSVGLASDSKGLASDSKEGISLDNGDERLAPVCHEGITVRLHSKAGATIRIQNGDTVSAVCQVPLRSQGQVCGLLTVDRRNKSNAFGQLDEQTLIILAHYASLAMERERVP